MKAKKYDPNEPVLKAIERLKLEPWYPNDEVRRMAENDPYLVEIGKMDALAILRNGGAKNAAEVEAMKKGGAE
jgi:hypothetical protein